MRGMGWGEFDAEARRDAEGTQRIETRALSALESLRSGGAPEGLR